MTTTTQYTFMIYNNGREVENVDAGTYPTEAAAELAGLAALDDLCPPQSPNRRYYRVESVATATTTTTTPQQIILDARDNWDGEQSLEEAICEWANCIEASIGDEGDVWLRGSGGDGWLRGDAPAELVSWLRDREMIA